MKPEKTRIGTLKFGPLSLWISRCLSFSGKRVSKYLQGTWNVEICWRWRVYGTQGKFNSNIRQVRVGKGLSPNLNAATRLRWIPLNKPYPSLQGLETAHAKMPSLTLWAKTRHERHIPQTSSPFVLSLQLCSCTRGRPPNPGLDLDGPPRNSLPSVYRYRPTSNTTFEDHHPDEPCRHRRYCRIDVSLHLLGLNPSHSPGAVLNRISP